MLTHVRSGAIRIRSTGDPRTIRAVINTEDEAADGLTLLVSGMNAGPHLRSRTVLFSHDPSAPIARTLELLDLASPRRTEALIGFPPAGISQRSEEILGLIRSLVLNGVSIGFTVDRPPELRGGRRIVTAWTLIEISIVACPALETAEIVARTQRSGKVLSSANHGRLSGHVDRIAGECAQMRDWLDSLAADDGGGDPCDPEDPDYDPEACDEEARARRQRDADALRLAAAHYGDAGESDADARARRAEDARRLRQAAR